MSDVQWKCYLKEPMREDNEGQDITSELIKMKDKVKSNDQWRLFDLFPALHTFLTSQWKNNREGYNKDDSCNIRQFQGIEFMALWGSTQVTIDPVADLTRINPGICHSRRDAVTFHKDSHKSGAH